MRSKRQKESFLERPRYSNRISYNELLDIESSFGRTLFGPVPAGHQREFFEYQKNVWIWYEKWPDVSGVQHEMTIRYEVRPSGVFKRIAGQGYRKLAGAELDNFRAAAEGYLRLLKANLYN